MKNNQKNFQVPIPAALITDKIKGNENITSSKAMLEYLSELDTRAPDRFRSLLEKPRVLHKAKATKAQQLALYELVRKTALITGEHNICQVWEELGYSIERDFFSLWKLPESSCEGWVNIKVSMITGDTIFGPVLFTPAGVWPLAVRLDAERLSSEEPQPDSEESSED